jgi:SAM-dependent methyltransferase
LNLYEVASFSLDRSIFLLTFYRHFSERTRSPWGVKIKKRQAEKIFSIGCVRTSESKRILELGPGDGYIAELAIANGLDYVAIDGSPAVANKLKAAGAEIRLQIMPPLPGGLGTYDVCFMLHVIEHLDNMSSASLLMEQVLQHLCPGGKIVIATPDFLRWGKHFYDCDYTHNLPFTRRRLRQLLQNTGYKVTHETVYTGPIFGRIGVPLHWISKLLYSRAIDDITTRKVSLDFWYRGYLTFLPSLLVVAQAPT